MFLRRRNLTYFFLLASSWFSVQASVDGQEFSKIRVSKNGKWFVRSTDSKPFVVWGVNYDHDSRGQLLDEYWTEDWKRVESDFQEIKDLGANCVRVHLQVGKFLESPDRPNQIALQQLGQLLRLAESKQLYLDITGLACYHKKNVPAWFDKLTEQQRWKAQAVFWESIASTCKDSQAVFCYDLMNEPILPGKKRETDWLAGEMGGKYFVQRLALDLNGRDRQQVAEAWVKQMVAAIRKHDPDTLVTVGVIPWVLTWPNSKPIFYSPEVAKHLDFVAVHFYPRKNEVDKAIQALKVYEIGKPILVEETFPLRCSQEELKRFIQQSSDHVDGWVSFYWGQTAKQLKSKAKPTIAEAITASWLESFGELAKSK